MNGLQLCRWRTVSRERNFFADFLQAKCDFYTEIGCFGFLNPLWGFRAMYNNHLRLSGKRLVDFLLVLTELFSLGVKAEALGVNIGLKSAILLQWGLADPKFQIGGVAPSNHSSLQKTRLNDLSDGIKIWTDLPSVLSQFTRLTDWRTDRQTELSSLDRVCSPWNALKRWVCACKSLVGPRDIHWPLANVSSVTTAHVHSSLQTCIQA